MEQKYYWLVWRESDEMYYEDVITEHPFNWIKVRDGATLINWKEITKEEYYLFNT